MNRTNQIPALDGLRGIAVLMVLAAHLGFAGHWADLGVDVFFVLSGFLITRILMAQREAGQPLKGFYVRRAGRIFPLYFLFMAIMFACYGWHWDILAAATYTTNMVPMSWAQRHPASNAPIAQVWSLCIEEHFYLLWPFAVMFLPRRKAIVAASVVAAGSLALCFAVDFAQVHYWPAWWVPQRASGPTWFHATTLTVGGLLALCESKLIAKPKQIAALAVAAIVGAVAITPLLRGLLTMPNEWGNGTGMATHAMEAVAVFCGAWWLSTTPARVVLELKPLCYVGQISYGLYLLQLPALMISECLGVHWIVGVAALFMVCAASFRWFESPVRDWARSLSLRMTNIPAKSCAGLWNRADQAACRPSR